MIIGSDAMSTDWLVGIFLGLMLCHRMDYETEIKSQWKFDIMDAHNDDL